MLVLVERAAPRLVVQAEPERLAVQLVASLAQPVLQQVRQELGVQEARPNRQAEFVESVLKIVQALVRGAGVALELEIEAAQAQPCLELEVRQLKVVLSPLAESVVAPLEL